MIYLRQWSNELWCISPLMANNPATLSASTIPVLVTLSSTFRCKDPKMNDVLWAAAICMLCWSANLSHSYWWVLADLLVKQQLIAIADTIVDFVDFENIRKAVIYSFCAWKYRDWKIHTAKSHHAIPTSRTNAILRSALYCHRPQSCPQSYCALNCIVLRIVLISPSIVSPSIVPYHRHRPHVHCIALNCIMSPSIGIVDTALNCIVLNNCLVLNRPQSYRITIVLNRIILSSIASYRSQSHHIVLNRIVLNRIVSPSPWIHTNCKAARHPQTKAC